MLSLNVIFLQPSIPVFTAILGIVLGVERIPLASWFGQLKLFGRHYLCVTDDLPFTWLQKYCFFYCNSGILSGVAGAVIIIAFSSPGFSENKSLLTGTDASSQPFICCVTSLKET